jgi:hypothetical protein
MPPSSSAIPRQRATAGFLHISFPPYRIFFDVRRCRRRDSLSRKSREQAKRIAALDRRQLADTTMLA